MLSISVRIKLMFLLVVCALFIQPSAGPIEPGTRSDWIGTLWRVNRPTGSTSRDVTTYTLRGDSNPQPCDYESDALTVAPLLHFKKLKPWITPGLIKSMSIRDKLYSTFIHCKNPAKRLSFENRYKFYRNSIVSLCRSSKNIYYHNFFATNLHNSKKIWSEINSIINNKSKSNNINCILINNVMNCKPASISKAFNTYFASVADSVRLTIPDSY